MNIHNILQSYSSMRIFVGSARYLFHDPFGQPFLFRMISLLLKELIFIFHFKFWHDESSIFTNAIVSHLYRFIRVGCQRNFITCVGPGTQDNTENNINKIGAFNGSTSRKQVRVMKTPLHPTFI